MERYNLMGTPYATQVEAEAGVNDKNLMTPLKTKQSIQKNAPVKTVNGETGDVIVDALPPGTIIAYAGDSVPDGFIDGSGAAVSRVTYERLFNVFGTKYGAGDGKTTFNLPNLNNGSFLEGSNTAGTVKSAGLPNITGKASADEARAFISGTTGLAGAFTSDTSFRARYQNQSGTGYNLVFDASLSNSIYGNSDTVQPKAVTVKFCIKY